MNDQKKIQVLQDVIRIPSVNGKEAEVASYLSKLFIDYSIESERVPYCPGRDKALFHFQYCNYFYRARQSLRAFWAYGCCVCWK